MEISVFGPGGERASSRNPVLFQRCARTVIDKLVLPQVKVVPVAPAVQPVLRGPIDLRRDRGLLAEEWAAVLATGQRLATTLGANCRFGTLWGS